ncbi:hypothetical protein D1007_49278 [Hordeum vulgare]|nr:hypothetical protein D1007_49278 [Hordeum vulgare]
MANFRLNPQRFLLAGDEIIDGGDLRLPQNFVTLPTGVQRHHEEFVIVEVMPLPTPNEIGFLREAVVQLLKHREVQVMSAQPWISSVGLFLLRDAGVCFALLQLPPIAMGDDKFFRFMKHNEGEGYRGDQGFRDGCLMFVGVPLNLRTTEHLRATVNTFGKFHYWINDDPYVARTIVFCFVP